MAGRARGGRPGPQRRGGRHRRPDVHVGHDRGPEGRADHASQPVGGGGLVPALALRSGHGEPHAAAHVPHRRHRMDVPGHLERRHHHPRRRLRRARGARAARARARDERRLRAHHPADALRRAGRGGTGLLGPALDRLRRLADHHPGPEGRAAHVPLPALRRLRPDRDDGRRRPARAGGPRPRRPARAPAAQRGQAHALGGAARRRPADRRRVRGRRGRRGVDARAERDGGLLQPPGGDRRGADRGRLAADRATAATSTPRATSSSPTGSRT